jgi:hypothetical protein
VDFEWGRTRTQYRAGFVEMLEIVFEGIETKEGWGVDFVDTHQ